jgi:DNA-directed RNA polymerase II subunit RPB2
MLDDKDWEDVILNKTMKSYFEEYDQSRIQKDNFDHFIHHRLSRIIEDESSLEVQINEKETFHIRFENVFVDKPYVIDENREIRYITPMEARFRDLNYSGCVFANIKTFIVLSNSDGTNTIHSQKTHLKKLITKIPIMVQSSKCNLYDKTEEERIHYGECKYDKGGYFIIKGKERALVSQERMNYNIVYVFEQKPSQKFQMIAEIRSMSEETRHSVFVQMKIYNKKIVLQLPYIQQEIPLGIVFRAYGFSLKEIECILKLNCVKWKENNIIHSFIQSVLMDAQKIETQENAINNICEYSLNTIMKERKQKYIIQILSNELFPHLGITSLKEHKGMFLGHMMNKLLLTFTGNRNMDDRDHINNKRIELSGYLLCELFRTLFKRFIRTIEPQLEKRQDIVVITNRLNIITLGINHCFATGNWGVPKSSYIRLGVSQILSRLTYISYCSHLRRILIPIGKEGKNTKVRQIHTSQIGFICPHETPEGQQSGIVKNMTSFIRVSLQYNLTLLREIIESIEFIETNFKDIFKLYNFLEKDEIYFIFINGNLIGMTRQFNKCWKQLNILQENNVISNDISFSYSDIDKEIHIFGDEGRLQRPLFPRKNFPSLEDLKTKSFFELVKENKIVFKDSYQVDNEIIAMTKKEMESKKYYTSCEIHPSVISGISVTLTPFSEHTQSPRVTYHAAMGKQAIGLPMTNIEHRVDTMNHILSYPEKPLIQSHHTAYSHLNETPIGNNLIVAILTYTGFNQEDSVIMNKSAIERGLFRSFGYKILVVEEKKKSTLMMEKIELVPREFQNKSFDYSKLDENGIIKVGTYVGVGDVIVSKLQKITDKMNNDNWHDNSIIIKTGEEGVVDKVYIMNNVEGYKIIKIRIRTYRIPEIGDKVASRCAQKGTISVVLNQEDMPITASGIVPDLIINPLCIPSRMTINQLIECFSNKSAVEKLQKRYSTSFSHHSINVIPQLQKELLDCGFEKNGCEIMYNGMSGERLEGQIFIGPTYYHRLKHLVGNKIHARNHGNIQALTRQPLEGRSRDGGLRFGEMERDTLVAYAPISLKCGLSIPLYEFKDNKKWDVLGWEEETDSIITKRQTEFLDKGEKECVEITLQDGKKLVCTPDHPMLTMDKEWVRAKNLKKNEHRLKVSLHYPIMKLKKDVQKCNNWSMNIGEILLETHSNEHYLNSLSFMRMMGLLCSDGGFYKSGNLIYANVNLGHKFDADVVKDDIQLFTQKDVSIKFCKNQWNGYFNIRLPQDLTNNLLHLEGLTIGRKIDQPIHFPNFILDKNLPTPLLREFIGALFGGDGHTCHLTKHRGKRDLLTSISFSRSSLGSNIEYLETYMNQLKELLERLGIEKTTIQKPKETTWSKNQDRKSTDTKCYQLNLHLDINELIPFHEKIGFRYNCHKSLRLEAGVSYRRLRETTIRQHNWMVNRVNELTDFINKKKENPEKIVPTKKAIEQAKKELEEKEPILHKYAIPTTHDITDHLIHGTTFGSFRSKSFPTAEEFIEEIGALEWFDDDYATKSNEGGLPTMNLKVIDIRPVGKHLVYDIEVDKIHSFLANGIVAHNCMISHGVSRFLRERLFDVSDYFEIYTCSQCGTIPHNHHICNMCQCKDIVKVPLPFACKLLFQELMAMGIAVNIVPKIVS